MGLATSTLLTPEERASLQSFSSPTGWALDSEEWCSLWRTKEALTCAAPEALAREMREVADRLLRNDGTSHNLATLAAHVTHRLPRAFYFSSTDCELTTNAVLLLRLFIEYMTLSPPSDVAAAGHAPNPLAAHFAVSPNPAATRSKERDEFSWEGLLAAGIDFLASAPLNSDLYELHVQVSTLLLTVCATQLTHPDIAAAASIIVASPATAAASTLTHESDPGIVAALRLGRLPAPTPVTATSSGGGGSTSSTGGKGASQQPTALSTATIPGSGTPNPTGSPMSSPGSTSSSTVSSLTRADALVLSLLRNIAYDGGRAEDDEPGPGDGSSAAAASTRVAELRAKAFAAVKEGGVLKATPTHTHSGDGIFGSVVSAASRVASLPGSLVGAFLPGEGEHVGRPLAERSTLLLLLLVHNCRSGIDASVLAAVNPYRHALTRLQDADNALSLLAAVRGDGADGGNTPQAGGSGAPPLRVRFKGVFKALTRLCETPLGTSLLYTLLHASTAFTDYMFTRSDIDDVLLPALHQLYRIGALTPEHRYILMITLLLFSQDPAWCENAHRRIKLSPKSIAWFGDRLLGEITLGSFIYILLARVLTSSPGTATGSGTGTPATGYASEEYLHTNCLAVLANMAPYTENIHPYAAQRLVSLLNYLAKKYKRAMVKVTTASTMLSRPGARRGASTGNTTRGAYTGGGSSAVTSGGLADPAPAMSDVEAEAALARFGPVVEHCDQCIRLVCDSLHACCAPSVVSSNIPLLYTLLLERDVIHSLAKEPAFEEVVAGLSDIITHFAGVLKGEEVRRGMPQASEQEAMLTSPTATASSFPLGASAPNRALTAAASPTGGGAGNGGGSLSGDVSQAGGHSVVWEEADVAAILLSAARSWRGGNAAADASLSLKDTKFAYEEDAHPELFFVPYVWALVLQFTADCAWSFICEGTAAAIQLFPPAHSTLFTNVTLPASDARTSHSDGKAAVVTHGTTPLEVSANV